MEYTKEELETRFDAVPQNIQGLILDENFGPAVTLLCKELDIDAMKALDVEDETLHVLVGISHPKDFIKNIQTKVGVDEQKARAIAEKVNDEIFQLVKESLKIVHNIRDEEEPKASLASVASSVPTPSSDAPGSTLNVPRPIPETPRPSQNIFEQKLQGVFKMPKEETLVPPKSFTSQPPQPPRPGGVDPYREQPK